jgi:galactokinase
MSIIKTKITDELLERRFDFFVKHFPDSGIPDRLGIGPERVRVNLIGEHTDYKNGFVLPMVSKYFSC